MKTLSIAFLLTLLPGCTLLSAVGGALGITGPQDLAPSLKYCQEVQYARKGIDAEIRAKCTVPAG